VCSESHAETRGGSAQGASPPDPGDARHPSRPEERYHDERVRLPAEEDARLGFLRGVIDEGASRGWKLVSALREPDGEALLLTWDGSGAFPG
jgi:hypothetical protein